MTHELNYVTFSSDAGWIGILGSAKGLLATTLPQQSSEKARQLLGDSADRAASSPSLFDDLMERLRIYFGGHKAAFPDELDLSSATPFQRQVWEIARLIPYGETRSYSWVAEQIGKPGAVRAVGQALGRNPLLIIIPCHRVLTSQGKLGGYREGVEMKRRLLFLEAAVSIRHKLDRLAIR